MQTWPAVPGGVFGPVPSVVVVLSPVLQPRLSLAVLGVGVVSLHDVVCHCADGDERRCCNGGGWMCCGMSVCIGCLKG